MTHEIGWQKMHQHANGVCRKTWTRTIILSPNICYFVAILIEIIFAFAENLPSYATLIWEKKQKKQSLCLDKINNEIFQTTSIFRHPATVKMKSAHHTGEEVKTKLQILRRLWCPRRKANVQQKSKPFILPYLYQVAVYAIGPQSHLFRGLQQQTYIPNVIAYAACIGEGRTFCQQDEEWNTAVYSLKA